MTEADFSPWGAESAEWARISAGVSRLWAEDWDSVEDAVYDDEPVEKIKAAFERGPKGVTAPPTREDLGPVIPGSGRRVEPKDFRRRPDENRSCD